LVEAFKATLEEVVVADFLIHVLDVTNPNVARHHATTLGVLAELGADRKTIIDVFNKTDIATPAALETARILAPGALFVSAKTGAGLDTLLAHCVASIARESAAIELLIPHDRYDIISRLHEVGQVNAQDLRDDGVHIHGSFPASQAAIFAPFVVPAT
jgi:GTP-binding protein HflX